MTGSVLLIFPIFWNSKMALYSTTELFFISPQYTNIPHLGIQDGVGFLHYGS